MLLNEHHTRCQAHYAGTRTTNAGKPTHTVEQALRLAQHASVACSLVQDGPGGFWKENWPSVGIFKVNGGRRSTAVWREAQRRIA